MSIERGVAMSALVHSLTCHWLRRWRRRRTHQPFWTDDKVAAMLGVAQYGCPYCGRGAVEERDRIGEK